ncbi:circularly permuted type 2 ATP-grasp protein [Hydrogenophaga sp. OTU3427]|uniref:circularly permuted type 2 ATP-grasp protein n=1 Tax=Hydrogenophaga sp. OTU3427 TaxID=3043856 RepID=UPI00313BA5AA
MKASDRPAIAEDHAHDSPAGLAAALASAAEPGHLDELRDTGGGLRPHWAAFFEHLGFEGLGDLNRRQHNLARQIRDNGVTYNVYADEHGAQRPWALDLLPMVVTPESWAQIEAGVLQRAKLLNRICADIYGPRELLKRALLPAALVQGHPGYLRAMHGVRPPGDTWLHIAAFDLARGPDGRWWVVSQRTQAPSGLGYLLENRIAIARQFPKAFGEMKVQRLAASYRALMDGIKRMAPEGANARIALLTPGPYNETYFEHAYLARYLGLSLVEGSDLTVRDQRVYLKTLQGLEPVHALIKRLDDEWLDPLELRSDSALGVPGLLQALRAGNVLLANAPGTAPLESSALLGFLPALSEHLLGEPLALPSLDTWWCGEAASLQRVLPLLKQSVIKPTRPDLGKEAVMGQRLDADALDQLTGRMVRQPDNYTVQAYLPLSQTPTWKGDRLGPRSAMLRVFALADGPQSWRVLPGGMVRLAPRGQLMASMQRGGSSADCWVLTEGEVDSTTLLNQAPIPIDQLEHKRPVTSRAAENLFWLGRYTERAENSVRLAQIALRSLHGEDQRSPALLAWLSDSALANGLVLPDVPSAAQSPRVFERSLIAMLAPDSGATSVGFNLRALSQAAASVRERLSQEQRNLIERVLDEFAQACEQLSAEAEYAPQEALNTLEQTSEGLAAITGAQTDRMVRDDGWRLLSVGRHIERLGTLSQALAEGLRSGSLAEEGGFEALVALFDSTITFHARYQQRRDLPALVDLLVLDRDNPRSLAWVLGTLRSRLSKLANTVHGQVAEIAQALPDPSAWQLGALCNTDDEGQASALLAILAACQRSALELSDDINRRHFSHADRDNRSLLA